METVFELFLKGQLLLVGQKKEYKHQFFIVTEVPTTNILIGVLVIIFTPTPFKSIY